MPEFESAVVRAIDVGYSMTKYTVTQDPRNCACFPSIATPASDRELGIGRRGRRNTVIVPVQGQRFELGPDARLAVSAVDIRPMSDDYVLTDEYLALCRGALRYMKVDHVDLLLVGLPVSLFQARRRQSEKRLTGAHDLGDGNTVVVERVIALAQPIGAFLSFAVTHQERRRMLAQRNLVIDAGGRTFDWLVTQGLKPIDKRSDSVNRGMADVVETLGRAICSELGTQLVDADRDRIDRALRRKEPLRFFGQEFDLTRHLKAGEQVARDAVVAMRKQVQEGSDIDNIILAGGGAFFFRKEVERVYAKHHVHQVDAPMFANVRGFQIAGLEWTAAEQRRTSRGEEVTAR